MKLSAIAVLCCALCIAQFSYADETEDQVKVLKHRAQGAVNYFKSYRKFLPEQLKGELKIMKENNTNLMDGVRDNNSNDLKSLAETARTEGKDPTACLVNAEVKDNTLKDTTEDHFDRCKDASLAGLNGVLDDVNKALIKGTMLVVELKMIFLNCPNGLTDEEVVICINQQFPAFIERIVNVENNVVQIQESGKQAFEKSLSEATLCYAKAVENFRAAAALVKAESETCIKNLQSPLLI